MTDYYTLRWARRSPEERAWMIIDRHLTHPLHEYMEALETAGVLGTADRERAVEVLAERMPREEAETLVAALVEGLALRAEAAS